MDLVYWLMLLKAPRVGTRTFYKILKIFETPEAVFLASESECKKSGLCRD
jgi:DNA processing protein